MWRYEAVIESLTRGRDLLPMRYGTVLADAAAATAQLAARRDEFARALDRVSGAAEVSVRAAEVTRPTDEPPISHRSSVGVAYLGIAFGLDRLGVSRVMVYMYLIPVAGVGLAAAFFGDPLTWARVLGGLIVLLGVILTRVALDRGARLR